jgi:hypothetical protein
MGIREEIEQERIDAEYSKARAINSVSSALYFIGAGVMYLALMTMCSGVLSR